MRVRRWPRTSHMFAALPWSNVELFAKQLHIPVHIARERYRFAVFKLNKRHTKTVAISECHVD
jgi:hypothetical protein